MLVFNTTAVCLRLSDKKYGNMTAFQFNIKNKGNIP